MRGFFAVLERELVERRLLAVVALVVGLLPLAVPWFSNAPHLNPADIRDGAALAFCMTFTVVVAILLGASVIAGDLAERRLGFYFSRPLSGWAIWGGKIVAAALLAVGGGLLVLLPVLLSGGEIDIQGAWPGRTLRANLLSLGVFWVACMLFLILAAHAASVMIRARSPWLAVDLVAATVVGLLLWSARFELLFMRALLFPSFWDVLAVALIFSGLAVAGAIQVVRGRTDPRRGHRALSLTLWGLLLTLAAASQGFAHWMLDVSPEDLTHVTEVSSAPSGSWIAFSGPARHRGEYRPHFLFDTTSGRYVRKWWGETLFSADGTRAVWLEPAGRSFRSLELVLYSLDLRDPDATPVRTTFSFDGYTGTLALSPRGDRLASIQGDRLLVEDLDRRKILASIPLPGLTRDLWQEGGMRFLDSEHILLLQTRALSPDGGSALLGGGFEMVGGVVDLSREKSFVPRRIATRQGYPAWTVSPDGSRVLFYGKLSITLLDLRTGREIATLPPELNPEFLADGRIAAKASSKELLIYSPDFVLERSFRFDDVLAADTGGQPAPGQLIVAVARPSRATSKDPSSWRVLLLDFTTGEVRSLAPRLLPAGSPKSGPRSIGSCLFKDEYGGLVVLDPATGKARILVRGSRPS